jgi:hypothetical protein
LTKLRPITASLILHLLVVGLLLLKQPQIKVTPKVDITVIERPKNSTILNKGRNDIFSKLIPKLGIGYTPKSRFNIDKEIANAKVEVAEQNILKKKEFIYSNFFTRIKKEVDPEWVKSIKQHFGKSRPKRNYSTVFLVIMDKTGLVIEIILVNSSGNDRIDGLVMDAMKGKMFPNPPKDLIESDGYGRIVWTYNIFR